MKEERQDKTTEDKRREDNTKEKREDRRLNFSVVVHGRFFFDVVIFWLIPFAPDSLANSVKSDSFSISMPLGRSTVF